MKRNTLITTLLVFVIAIVIVITSAFSFRYALPFLSRVIVQKAATTCNETDNGVLFYSKGIISLCTGATCVLQGEDLCNEGIVTEYYCTEKNEIKTLDLKCPYGCDDGACMARGQKPKPKVQVPLEENKSAEEQVKEIICDEGWQCVGKVKIYQNLDCSLIKETYCKYGCVENECKKPGFWEKFLLWLEGQII